LTDHSYGRKALPSLLVTSILLGRYATLLVLLSFWAASFAILIDGQYSHSSAERRIRSQKRHNTSKQAQSSTFATHLGHVFITCHYAVSLPRRDQILPVGYVSSKFGQETLRCEFIFTPGNVTGVIERCANFPGVLISSSTFFVVNNSVIFAVPVDLISGRVNSYCCASARVNESSGACQHSSA
jgi:hypothetical protein